MATKRSTKAAVETEAVEEVEEVISEPTNKALINSGIDSFLEATGGEGQKARYKAMRAIAYQAFVESLENGDFDELVQRAIEGADELPAGWGLERTVAAEPVEKPAKSAPAKAKSTPAKTAAKATPAKRSTAKTPAKASTGRTRPTR